MSDHRSRDAEPAHDVLAAEEFGVPARDPALQEARAHDVLAAEEFGVPARDPALHHGPVNLPTDPTGIAEPHDVLAAEEFAMPVGRRRDALVAPEPQPHRRSVLAAAALALLASVLWRRRRS